MKKISIKQSFFVIFVGILCCALFFSAGVFALKNMLIGVQVPASADIICKIEVGKAEKGVAFNTNATDNWYTIFDNTISTTNANEGLGDGITRSISNGVMSFSGAFFADITSSTIIYVRISNSTSSASDSYISANITNKLANPYCEIKTFSENGIESLATGSSNMFSFNINSYFYQTGTTPANIALKLNLWRTTTITNYTITNSTLTDVVNSNPQTSITNSQNYTTTLYATNSNAVSITSITVGGTAIFEGPNTFNFNPKTGDLIIYKEAISGNITISATTKSNRVNLTISLSNDTKLKLGNQIFDANTNNESAPIPISSEETLEFELINLNLDNTYISLPNLNNGSAIARTSYVIQTNSRTTKVSIPSSLIKGSITISDTSVNTNIRTVGYTLSNCATEFPINKVANDTNFVQKLFVNSGYEFPATITITGATNYNYNRESGLIIIPSASITGNIAITAIAFSIQNNLTECYVSETIITNENFEQTLVANAGYVLPATITITIGGTNLAVPNYTYNPESGIIIISSARITGNIAITATAFLIQNTLTECYVSETIITNENFEQTLVANPGYVLPNTLNSITLGGADFTASNYTYNQQSGKLTIPLANITDDIAIIVVAIAITP